MTGKDKCRDCGGRALCNLYGPVFPGFVRRRIRAVYRLDALPAVFPNVFARHALSYGITRVAGLVDCVDVVAIVDGALVMSSTVTLPESCTEAEVREAIAYGLDVYHRKGDR